MTFSLYDFVKESNRIEGILREPTDDEMCAHITFLETRDLTIKDLEEFVAVIAPGHVLRDKSGFNVRVGNHIAPAGGPEIRAQLQIILDFVEGGELAWRIHTAYEDLHPFTDGNGRSGRALWLWQMGSAPLGFLHQFYYQTLENQR